MPNPLVSVIIPVHNRFAFAHESVNTILAQSHRPIELIIVDDLSDEPYVPKIASEIGFEIKVIRHRENKGPGASRETGRLAANGEYIAYLDSDDLWHPQNLEKAVVMLHAHPEAGMCYSKTVFFDNPENIDVENLRWQNVQTFNSFLPTLFWGRPWSTSACLWTREASDLIGPWFSGWTWEDREYDYRAGIKEIKICHVPEVLCYKRENDGVDQLSRCSDEKAILQSYDSIRAIGNNVVLHKKKLDNETRVLFVKKVFRPLLVQLIEFGDSFRITSICKDMVLISPFLSKTWWIALALWLFSALSRKSANRNFLKYFWIHLT